MVTLVGDLARGPGDTAYVHLGDAFGQVCAAAIPGLLGAAIVFRSRRTAVHSPL